MIRINFLVISLCLVASAVLTAQHTTGLVSYNMSQTYEGYTLIYPHNQANVYLLNNCGEIVHQWEDEDIYRPGNTAYLLENGNLVKTKRNSSIANDSIWAGGGGAFVEIRSWDNELLWRFEMNNEERRLHHDIAPMKNGNILMLAWERKTNAEAIQAGRKPELLNQIELWPDYVFEVDPNTDEIVWEWHVWDHLIQDYDNTKDNFGVVSNHPELVDINYDTQDGKADWLHGNALDYNEELDQILISIPYFDEVWVVDHSTSTSQAQGHFGGNSNHGGDLLYRVGNQQTYQKGDSTDQILFFQHDAHWVNEFIPPSHPNFGDIILFNNRIGDDYSSIEIFETEWSMYVVDYPLFDGTWPPYSFENTITHPEREKMYSTGLSSAQLLPNGNVLACSGRTGYIFELNSNNEVVWEYITPLVRGIPASSDTVLSVNDNLTFRAFKFPPEYSAFEGRNLEPKGYIELNPDEAWCGRLVSTSTPSFNDVKVFPNPANSMVHLSWNFGGIVNIQIFDAIGRERISTTGNGGMKYLDISELNNGIYFVILDDTFASKLLISNH